MFSLRQLFLSHRWDEQMQADSHPIVKSLRSETLAVVTVLRTLDFCPGEGFDFTGDVAAQSFEDVSYDIVRSTKALDPQKGLLGEGVCAEARRASVSNTLTSLCRPLTSLDGSVFADERSTPGALVLAGLV